MAKITNCRNCGAPINWRRGICEYCGTHYREFDPLAPPRVVFDRRPAQVYRANVGVPWATEDYMGPEEVQRYMTDRLAEELTAAVAQNMDVEYTKDPETMTTIARATIRILPKDFRF